MRYDHVYRRRRFDPSPSRICSPHTPADQPTHSASTTRVLDTGDEFFLPTTSRCRPDRPRSTPLLVLTITPPWVSCFSLWQLAAPRAPRVEQIDLRLKYQFRSSTSIESLPHCVLSTTSISQPPQHISNPRCASPPFSRNRYLPRLSTQAASDGWQASVLPEEEEVRARPPTRYDQARHQASPPRPRTRRKPQNARSASRNRQFLLGFRGLRQQVPHPKCRVQRLQQRARSYQHARQGMHRPG